LKVKNVLIVILLGVFSSTLFGVEIDKKAHDQALKDLELSKKQASLLLKDELKKYDLSRLPPHYKKMLDEHLFGDVPNDKKMVSLKASYDKVVAGILKDAADGKGGNYSLLNQSFQDAIAGKSKLISTTVPFKSGLTAISSTNQVKLLANPSSDLESKLNAKAEKQSVPTEPESSSAEIKSQFKDFVQESKKFLKQRTTKTIFDRHSEVYLNEIYQKMNRGY
jgi:hypothetical protein